VSPIPRIAGELVGLGWVAELTTPAADWGGCAPLGRGGRVLLPLPGPDMTARCTATTDQRVLLAHGAECSDVEPPPFFGVTEREQRACAWLDSQNVEALNVTVDGGEPIDIRRPPFAAFSRQLTVQLPAGNILGVAPQPATFTAFQWAAVTRELRPGHHTITIQPVGRPTPGASLTFTYLVDVVGSGR
jgi:hypothetical protein